MREARERLRGIRSDAAEDDPDHSQGTHYAVFQERTPQGTLHGVHRVNPGGGVDPRAQWLDDDAEEAEREAEEKNVESAYKSQGTPTKDCPCCTGPCTCPADCPHCTCNRADTLHKSNSDHHDGAMVALHLKPEVAAKLALPDGEKPGDLHITLCYIGKASDLSTKQIADLHRVTRDVANERISLTNGHTAGLRTFPPSEGSDGKEVLYARPAVTGLQYLRYRLNKELQGAGVPAKNDYGAYKPHITLRYQDPGTTTPSCPSVPLDFDHVTVTVRGKRKDYALAAKDVAKSKAAPKIAQREKAILSEDSPLNRSIRKAADLPDMRALLYALAYEMSEQQMKKLADRAGSHPQAILDRIKQLRAHACQQQQQKDQGAGKALTKARGHFDRTVTQPTRLPEHLATKTDKKGATVPAKADPHLPDRYSTGMLPAEYKRKVSYYEDGGYRVPPPHLAESGQFSHHIFHPGAHGSTHWYRDRQGEIQYGDRPLYHVNGAGHIQEGAPPQPFRAHVALDTTTTLGQHIWRELAHQGVTKDEIGTHLALLRPRDLLRLAIDTSQHAYGEPTHAPAYLRILEPLHEEAQAQFRAHPMHTSPLAATHPLRDGTIDPAHRPLEIEDMRRLMSWWEAGSKDMQQQGAGWYLAANALCRAWSEQTGVNFNRCCAVLAIASQQMEWDRNVMIAKRAIFESVGMDPQITSDHPLDVPVNVADPKVNGASVHMYDDPMRKIRAILDPTARVSPSQWFGKADKVRSFYMNIRGIGSNRAVTMDTHGFHLLGQVEHLATGKWAVAKDDDATYNYDRRLYIAAGHHLGVPPEVVQAVTWAYYVEHVYAKTQHYPERAVVGTAADHAKEATRRGLTMPQLERERAAQLKVHDKERASVRKQRAGHVDERARLSAYLREQARQRDEGSAAR